MKHRVILWLLLALALTVTGCPPSTDVSVIYSGHTRDGTPFQLIHTRVGISRDVRARNAKLHVDRLHVCWYSDEAEPNADSGDSRTERRPALLGAGVLIPRSASTYLQSDTAGWPLAPAFSVFSEANRLWLVDLQREQVLAAADFDDPRIFAYGAMFPAWAGQRDSRLRVERVDVPVENEKTGVNHQEEPTDNPED